MSSVDSIPPGATSGNPDRDPRNQSATNAPAPPTYGGVLQARDMLDVGPQVDPRRTAVEEPPEKDKKNHTGRTVVLTAAGTTAVAVVAGWFLWPNGAQTQEERNPNSSTVGIAPQTPDSCGESFTLPSFFSSDAEQLAVYDQLDSHGASTEGLGREQSGTPIEWLALSFTGSPGSKYALATRNMDRPTGGLGEVVVTPLEPSQLRFDSSGRATVYVPTPSGPTQYTFTRYDNNRPGAGIGTSLVPFMAGGADPGGVSGREASMVCATTSGEVQSLGAGGGSMPGGGGSGNEGQPGGAPNEGLANDGEVTSNQTP